MRWLAVFALLYGCHAPPARDPADIERIRTLEARVAALEAQLAKPAVVPKAKAPAEPEPEPPPVNAWPHGPRNGPSPAVTYNVPLDDSPQLGPNEAAVTMVASLQFPEPFTHRVMPTLVQLRAEYPKDLRIVVKTFVVHPIATTSSIAGCAATYQGALDAIEPAIWDAANDPAQRTGQGMRQLDAVELRELVRSLRLDLKDYDRDFATCTAAEPRDHAMLQKLGQRGVPMFWINGRPLSGAQPIENFRSLIDEEREKWKADKAKGGKAATYYERITAGAPTTP